MIEVKTTYTVEEFEDYLAYSILRDSAEPLGWGPIVPAVRPGIEIKTVASNTNASPSVLTLSAPLVNAFPAGTALMMEDNVVALTLNAEAVGATVIEIDIALTLNAWQDKRVAFIYRGQQAPIKNPKFRSVVDEALRQMGLENIEFVNETNVQQFRLLGRLELLRRVGEDRSYQYDYTENANSFDTPAVQHQPSGPTQNILNLYRNESNKFFNTLNPPSPVEVVVSGIPEESLSQSSGVAIKW